MELCNICANHFKNLDAHNANVHTKMYWDADNLEFIVSCKPKHIYVVYTPAEPFRDDMWVSFVPKDSVNSPFAVTLKFVTRDVTKAYGVVPTLFITEGLLRKSVRSATKQLNINKVITHPGMWEDYMMEND